MAAELKLHNIPLQLGITKVDFDYAINSQDAVVISTAQTISASLPEGRHQSAYAARATFDYHQNILYDNAPVVARSIACLSAGVGDCDEQTNAFLDFKNK